MKRISPPNAVHAKPTTTPGLLVRSATSEKNILGPKYSSTTEGLTKTFFFVLVAISFAVFLHKLASCLSKFLTPASRVYDSIVNEIASSVIDISDFFKP